MIRRGTLIAVGVLVALTIISGVVDGRFTRRWGTPPDLAVAGQRLRNILEPQDATDPQSPRKGEQKIGDWEFKGEEKLSSEVVEILQDPQYVNWTFQNTKTNEQVNIAILVGLPGPISVHTPEICYSSQDNAVIDQPKPFQLDTAGATPGSTGNSQRPASEQFWGMTFKSNKVQGTLTRVVYAWNARQGWRAPSQPRFKYGMQPLLYKMQLAGFGASEEALKASDPCVNFLRDFLPRLDAAVLADDKD